MKSYQRLKVLPFRYDNRYFDLLSDLGLVWIPLRFEYDARCGRAHSDFIG